MSRVRLNGSAALHDGGFAYSATVAPGPLLFTAGISPLDADGVVEAPGDVVAQTRKCLQNLSVVLAEQGASMADIAKLTIYVAERLQVDLSVAWDAVVAEFGSEIPPAMMLGVTVLPYDEQVVEIEAIAAPGRG
ncbi:RidA family protein [Gordonia insulae]|uniref:2-iminobutanoate/2-iminopropanoate deaminase n=1 Tax=Gordonia insulae TaxID=2420509 RepID=A0A3G8JNQ4_9ACTN|nr:RidA family protein [Gordonia insulae]AZG46089.1 2-iminobutanoate/2-iminopropanoate deaminase [Gordonia insulae]